jgi:pimeloyl-ACP methyl ester carboxylesterase
VISRAHLTDEFCHPGRSILRKLEKGHFMAESDTETADVKTETFDVPGATLTYDIREAEGESAEPALLMIGQPMDARGFNSLAKHFRDRRVVTYDPRGVTRSLLADDSEKPTVEDRADDLHRLISELGGGSVDIFGSSGGAVDGLALVGKHPEQVRTLVAHEPPAAQVLPDREEALAAAADIQDSYMRDGLGPAMAKFIALTSLKGPIPADWTEQPAPNPADFGLPTQDDGSRDDPLLGNMISGTHYQFDFDALRAAPTRIVVAAGAESEGEFTHRAALAVAKKLETEAAIFPSHHAGFLGGEFGQRGDPDAFAGTLRRVLSEDG